VNILPRPRTRTFGQAMRRALLMALTCCALLAAPAIGASLLPIPMDYNATPGHSETGISRAERMVESGRCWVGEAPAEMEGVVPGHVWANGTYRGERGVAAAFEQLVFDGVLPASEWTQPVDHGLTVNAFCR
jgi:hypothetical protein